MWKQDLNKRRKVVGICCISKKKVQLKYTRLGQFFILSFKGVSSFGTCEFCLYVQHSFSDRVWWLWSGRLPILRVHLVACLKRIRVYITSTCCWSRSPYSVSLYVQLEPGCSSCNSSWSHFLALLFTEITEGRISLYHLLHFMCYRAGFSSV